MMLRVAAGLAGLVFSVTALGACEEPHGKNADAVSCMAYLALQGAAVSEGRAQGDAATLDAAATAWRALAEQKYLADELAQYFASSVAAFDDMPEAELTLLSGVCAANAPITQL
jgi:hypothetical protein